MVTAYLWILPILFIVIIAVVFFLLQHKNSKDLKQKLSLKEQEYKHQSYENLLLDLIHQRFGYLIDINLVLDTIIESLTSIIGYTAVSYVVVTPNKMRFRCHMHAQVPKTYIETLKSRLVANGLNGEGTFQAQMHLEETISGNLVDDSLSITPASFIDLPIVVNERLEGYVCISSSVPNFYSEYDRSLVKKSISRVLVEVSRLKELIENEKTKLEVMVDKMDSGVILIDEDFSIIAINSTCINLLGLKSKDDTTIFEIAGAFGSGFALDVTLADVLKNGINREFANITYKDKTFEINVIPIASSVTKKNIGIVINDKTSEKKFEQVKDDFVSMMVHELRSPLTIIKGAADMIQKRESVLTVEQRSTLLSQIKDSATDLLGLVNDLLDSAKIEAGKISIIKKVGDINTVLVQVVTEFRPLAMEKKLSLTLDTDVKIGVFAFDTERIEHVMTNLISNALKFTKEGGIHIYSKNIGNFVEIGVEDTGVGIREKDKATLFNKYAQVQEKATSKEKGTGLGLVICKGIVEAHGGKIVLEDNLPHGAVFKFTLPLSNEAL